MLNPDGACKYPEGPDHFSASSGPDTILEMAEKHAGELVIVAIAPLTNLARAINKNPDQMRKVKEIVLMGGAFETYGNVSLNAEFNIFADPHAAQVVCDSGIPLVFMPLDVTHQVNLLRDRLAGEVEGRTDLLAQFAFDSTLAVTEFDSQFTDFYGTHLHDPLTVVYLTHPELFETVETRVDVETEGALTRGRTVAECRAERQRPNPNARVCMGVKVDEALECFYKRLLQQ